MPRERKKVKYTFSDDSDDEESPGEKNKAEDAEWEERIDEHGDKEENHPGSGATRSSRGHGQGAFRVRSTRLPRPAVSPVRCKEYRPRLHC